MTAHERKCYGEYIQALSRKEKEKKVPPALGKQVYYGACPIQPWQVQDKSFIGKLLVIFIWSIVALSAIYPVVLITLLGATLLKVATDLFR